MWKYERLHTGDIETKMGSFEQMQLWKDSTLYISQFRHSQTVLFKDTNTSRQTSVQEKFEDTKGEIRNLKSKYR
jgi:hypothetical protein